MSGNLKEISYEQASDLIGSSQVLEEVDLGSFSSHLINHPTKGMALVTSSADGKASVLFM